MAQTDTEQKSIVVKQIVLEEEADLETVSRLLEGAHWLTDVALSTALTVFVVDSIDKYLDREMNEDPLIQEKNKTKVSWRLKFGGNQIGIIGTF